MRAGWTRSARRGCIAPRLPNSWPSAWIAAFVELEKMLSIASHVDLVVERDRGRRYRGRRCARRSGCCRTCCSAGPALGAGRVGGRTWCRSWPGRPTVELLIVSLNMYRTTPSPFDGGGRGSGTTRCRARRWRSRRRRRRGPGRRHGGVGEDGGVGEVGQVRVRDRQLPWPSCTASLGVCPELGRLKLVGSTVASGRAGRCR